MSGLLLGILSVSTCCFHNMVTVLHDLFRLILVLYMVIPLFTVQFYPYFLTYVKVQFSTHSIMSLYVMFFCPYWASCHDVSRCLIKLLQSLHLLSVPVCNIFVAWHLVCNAWYCAPVISPSFSPFRSPQDSHTKVSSSPISCLSIHLIYWPSSQYQHMHNFNVTG